MIYCVNSDGNRVNLGDFDSDGLNVDNYWDDNRNSYLGVSVARNFFLSIRNALQFGERFVYRSFVDFIQPPNILPISSTNVSSAMYFLASIVLVSFNNRKNTRKKFNLRLVFSKMESFSDLEI